MSKNKILFLSKILCQICLVFYALGLLFAAAGYVYWFMDPEYFQNFVVDNATDNFLKITSLRGDETLIGDGRFLLSDISPLSLTYLYIQLTGSFILIFLSIQELKKVIESVENINTFREENVLSFRKIGLFALGYCFLNIVSFAGTAENTSMRIVLDPTAVIIMLAGFLLSEIFSEGSKLTEESRMTI